MEISFTVRRGSDDQPLTFSFLAPAVQAALRRGLQAAAQRAQQRQAGEQPTAEGGTSLTAQNVFSAVPAAAPATAAATSAAASSAASAAAPASTTGPSPASAVATAAAAAATGMAQPDLTRMVERIHRMSGAVAGSIFQDLLAGAIQPGEAGPPPASDAAIDKLVREAAPVEGQGQCSVCLADLACVEPAAGTQPFGIVLALPSGRLGMVDPAKDRPALRVAAPCPPEAAVRPAGAFRLHAAGRVEAVLGRLAAHALLRSYEGCDEGDAVHGALWAQWSAMERAERASTVATHFGRAPCWRPPVLLDCSISHGPRECPLLRPPSRRSGPPARCSKLCSLFSLPFASSTKYSSPL